MALRKKIAFAALCVFLISVCGYRTVSAEEPYGPEILVGLFRARSATFRFSGTFSLSGHGVTFAVPNGATLNASVSGSAVQWQLQSGGQTLLSGSGSTTLALVPADPASSQFEVTQQSEPSLYLTGKAFRGSLLLMFDSGQLYAVNLVGVEPYVWSVVSCEMPDGWPIEALKAQAVAARSYALNRAVVAKETLVLTRKTASEATKFGPLDVKLSASDQVYRGVTDQDPNAGLAARATAGMVAVYQGKAIAAYFCSDAAGLTENVKYVWGGTIPYLISVREVPHDSPHSSWEYVTDETDLASKLKVSGPVTSLQGIIPGDSGRWSKVVAAGSFGQSEFTATSFRALTGIKSMWFSVWKVLPDKVRGQLNATLPASAEGISGRSQVILRESYAVSDSETPQVLAGGAVVEGEIPTGVSSPTYVFQGKGWGHGAGLSQWGASAMASQGSMYTEIITFYYPGTTVERWW